MRYVMSGFVLCAMVCCVSVGTRPPDLVNMGNTCYFNSLVQNIYNIEPITVAILAQKPPRETPLIDKYAALIAEFRAGKTRGFEALLQKFSEMLIEKGASIGMAPGAQDDPTLGLNVLSTDYSNNILPVFKEKMGFFIGKNAHIFLSKWGGSESSSSAVRTENIVETLAVIPAYPVIVDGAVTQYNIFSAVVQYEYFKFPEGDEGYMALPIVGECPEILMVWVLVFTGALGKDGVYRSSRIATNFDGASFFKPLDISSAVIPDQNGVKDSDTVYNLIGVSCHSGFSVNSGHYTALIKDQYDPDRPWYICDDSWIEQVDAETIQNEIRTKGYVFFYRKKSSEEASIKRQRDEMSLHNLALALQSL